MLLINNSGNPTKNIFCKNSPILEIGSGDPFFSHAKNVFILKIGSETFPLLSFLSFFLTIFLTQSLNISFLFDSFAPLSLSLSHTLSLYYSKLFHLSHTRCCLCLLCPISHHQSVFTTQHQKFATDDKVLWHKIIRLNFNRRNNFQKNENEGTFGIFW